MITECPAYLTNATVHKCAYTFTGQTYILNSPIGLFIFLLHLILIYYIIKIIGNLIIERIIIKNRLKEVKEGKVMSTKELKSKLFSEGKE